MTEEHLFVAEGQIKIMSLLTAERYQIEEYLEEHGKTLKPEHSHFMWGFLVSRIYYETRKRFLATPQE